MNSRDLELLREDILREDKMDEQEEIMLRTDYDYALDKFNVNVALQQLVEVVKAMNRYGWNVDAKELL